MKNFVKKLEIFNHLKENHIKPRDPKFKQVVEAFLLEKFALHSHQIEEKALKKLKTEIHEFHRKYKEFCDKKGYNKDLILKNHEVRKVVFKGFGNF